MPIVGSWSCAAVGIIQQGSIWSPSILVAHRVGWFLLLLLLALLSNDTHKFRFSDINIISRAVT